MAEDISHTIGTAQDQYIFAPIVYAAGFNHEESAKTRGIGYQEEKAPTIRAGVVPGVIILDDKGGRPNVVYCMETFHANVAIDKAGALRARDYKDPPIIIWESRESEAAKSGKKYIINSNGMDIVNALCARDESIKNQLVDGGKLIIEKIIYNDD